MDPYLEIRQRLVERYRRLARRLLGIEHDLGPAHIGEVPEPDALAEIVEAAGHELGLIQAAFRNMATRRYGICSECSGQIGLQRLQVLPYAARCEKCAPGLDFDSLAQLRVEHLGLNRLLGAIKGLLAERADAEERVATDRAIVTLLADLARELPQHFAHEERGGYFSDVIAVAPRLSKRANELLGDHDDFLRLSSDVLELAKSAGASPEKWSEVQASYAALEARILAHESAENELVQEAFMSDVSAGD
jgi:hypothetical protein